jgi:hypothetical protein
MIYTVNISISSLKRGCYGIPHVAPYRPPHRKKKEFFVTIKS